LKEIVYISIMA